MTTGFIVLLSIAIMADLITEAVLALRDDDSYQRVLAKEEQDKARLKAIAKRWADVTAFLEENE